MKNIFLFSLFLLNLLICALPCTAEELEPKRWSHLPLDKNFVGTGYANTEASISLDPVLRIENGEVEMHTWSAKYIRTFKLLEKSARFDFLQAYQDGSWSGLLDSVPQEVNRSGLSDSFVRFAINLYGAPPLKSKEYAEYRSKIDVETIVGAGFSVQLPTGDYMDDKLINLGTNRYTFRPQVGVVHTRGKWSTEVTGTVALYSDNDEFFNGKKLEQDPLYIIHSHLVYTFRPGVWAGISAGYDYGGRSTVDNSRKDDRKEDLAWAFSFGFPVTRHLGVKMVYLGTRTQENVGIDSDTFAMGFAAFW
jgi:hypothetical protein